MKRFTILTIIAFFTLILVPAAVIGGQAGPPDGLNVTLINPLPLPITGEVEIRKIPLQIYLIGSFQEANWNLVDTILGPRSYTIPDGFSSLLIKHVSCRTIVGSGQKVQIMLETNFSFPGSGSSPGNLIEFIPDNEIFGELPQPRQVSVSPVHAYLGISTPGGPITGDTLVLKAQRDTRTGTGSVRCVISGELE